MLEETITADPTVPCPESAAAGSGYDFNPRFNSVNGSGSDKLSGLLRVNEKNDLGYDAFYEWATTRSTVQESRPQIIDSYIDLFRQAVKRCETHSQTVGVGLSGRRDSRHILLELCNSGRAPFAILRHRRQTVFAPYLDPDLSSFLAGLPPAVTFSRQLHAEVIAKAYPKYAGIPYAGRPEQSLRPLAHYRRIATDVLRYVLVNPSPMVDRKKVCVQLLRAMVLPSHCADVLYVGRYAVYLTELCKALSPPAATIHG